MSDSNIVPVIVWWWFRRRNRRRQEKRKLWVHQFFRDNFNSGAYIFFSKELNQDPELLKSLYKMGTESFSFISGSCRTSNSKKRYKISYSCVSRRKTTDSSQVRKVYLFTAIYVYPADI
jgi:hypothetical protein